MKTKLAVIQGDITRITADAIVNAANTSLLGGGGVDGAIHRAGGPAIFQECMQIRDMQGGCDVGKAVVTTAGDLQAKYVIHTVGPIFGMNNGRDAELLEACYRNSVMLAVANDLTTIAFPSISTGAFGYPKHEAAPVVYRTAADLLEQHSSMEIRLVFFSASDAESFIKYRV